MKNEPIFNKEYFIKSIISVVQHDWSVSLINKKTTETVKRNSDILVYIREGYATYEYGDETNIARAGDVVYLSRGTTYIRTVHSDRFFTTYVNFNFNTSNNVTLPCHVFSMVKNVDTLFLRLIKKWLQNDSTKISGCMSILYEIYSSLIESEISSYISSSKRSLFEAAVKEIQNNYTEKEVPVNKLAARANMSEVHFRRLFKKIYKMSPRQYAINLKISRAKELLQYSSFPVSDISYQIGFSDPCYFSRLFREKTGVSPSEYRDGL